MKAIALIPARSGSLRVPDKNVRPLSGHPLMAYTISAAIKSRLFEAVMVSTDSEYYAEVARYYGAEVPFLRPSAMASECSPDIEWIEYTLKQLEDEGHQYDCFSILRPTSPFRQVNTIKRAWKAFTSDKTIDSLRAVEKCKQHPGKMWVIRGNRMMPLLPLNESNQPWHSRPYQSLPEVYVQNASLEMAWTRVVLETHTISGNHVMPFFTEDYEGFDINDPYDWQLAEQLVKTGKARLPKVGLEPFIFIKRLP
ncbi:MAG: acylneuraminate cytidylyltransferase family protein [Deltaproteobacteria bacterium]|nr:acylneuraminate cytidylyltransferase family protein [Deltaproteobacteria bacterium]